MFDRARPVLSVIAREIRADHWSGRRLLLSAHRLNFARTCNPEVAQNARSLSNFTVRLP
jgi:hypothetical protein